MTFSAGMATSGIIPIVCVYSTFLQRAYDQILHDVCLNHKHVVFAIDRAGFVADDGETHQGLFDIAFLSQMPGMTVMVPANGAELRQMLTFAVAADGPVAVRYPKSTKDCDLPCVADVKLGRCLELQRGERVAISFLGPFESMVREVAENLASDGVTPTIANARFAAPFDEEWIRGLADSHETFVTVEEGVSAGGYGETIAAWCNEQGIRLRVVVIAAPKTFFAQASREELLAGSGLTADAVTAKIRGLL